ncbi:hypothetical protein SAMN05660236_1099 [Ohtaekwangia koreensis]|uniref:Uncharacterized protein n=1 Tax=Ohtaekwangia koreensis TaxID=688867 RepID=A0A1T5JI87_9BACT|nr:hypothetical protein SAMN05660236_1099 [Ohtaekwangia koreensis]
MIFLHITTNYRVRTTALKDWLYQPLQVQFITYFYKPYVAITPVYSLV